MDKSSGRSPRRQGSCDLIFLKGAGGNSAFLQKRYHEALSSIQGCGAGDPGSKTELCDGARLPGVPSVLQLPTVPLIHAYVHMS